MARAITMAVAPTSPIPLAPSLVATKAAVGTIHAWVSSSCISARSEKTSSCGDVETGSLMISLG